MVMKFCRIEIRELTKLIATSGITLSFCSLFTVLYLPFGLVLLAAYVILLVGLYKKRISYLTVAQLAFSTNICFNIALVALSVLFAFSNSDDLWLDDDMYFAKEILHVITYIWIFLIIVITCFSLFSFIVTQKFRNLLIFEYLDANLPPAEEPRPRLNLQFGNIYSSDPTPN